jgi:purine-binding chemotaxis protein CheW
MMNMTSTSVTSPVQPAGAPAVAGKFLTFALGQESYGIPVLNVREIIKLVPITAVPQMPDLIKGVINLRGKIIPVVDLGTKFGLAHKDADALTCIVVVQVNSSARADIPMGLIVDGVEEVVQIGAADIEETPDFGLSIDTSYILGMAKIKGAVKTLLDINRVVGGRALEGLAERQDPEGSLGQPAKPALPNDTQDHETQPLCPSAPTA